MTKLSILVAIARKEHPSWTETELKNYALEKNIENLERGLK